MNLKLGSSIVQRDSHRGLTTT